MSLPVLEIIALCSITCPLPASACWASLFIRCIVNLLTTSSCVSDATIAPPTIAPPVIDAGGTCAPTNVFALSSRASHHSTPTHTPPSTLDSKIVTSQCSRLHRPICNSRQFATLGWQVHLPPPPTRHLRDRPRLTS